MEESEIVNLPRGALILSGEQYFLIVKTVRERMDAYRRPMYVVLVNPAGRRMRVRPVNWRTATRVA